MHYIGKSFGKEKSCQNSLDHANTQDAQYQKWKFYKIFTLIRAAELKFFEDGQDGSLNKNMF